MVAKAKMGIMPDLDAIKMLADMMAVPLIMGWVAHFMIGTIIWGGLFAVLVDKIPGSVLTSAILFSIGVWFMMIGPMPMAGSGLFGLQLGVVAPIATFKLHIIWGIALGFSYKRLTT